MILKEITKKVKSIFKHNKIKALLLINVLLFISCGSKSETQEPEDNTNPIGNIITATPKDLDGDGKVNDIAFKITATDNVAVENIDLTVNGNFAEKVGSEYILSDLAPGNYTAKLNVTDTSDNPSTEVTKNFTIEDEADTASTVGNPTNTVDENSTVDIDLDIQDQNGISAVTFNDEANNELAQYFNIIENGKLQLQSGVILNHEVQPTITGVITITDALGNTVEKTITINLNDIQEQQTINVLGDNELLPNGEKYAIKTDQEEAGETLPIKYYNHGNSRRLKAAIEDEIVNSAVTYGDAQTDIYNLYGTNIGPKFANGQVMLSFDGTANEMIIHAEDGSESARIDRVVYGRMMHRIKNRTGFNSSIEFVQDGKVLNKVWEDMIVLQANNPSNLYVAVDKAIQNQLGQ